MSLFGDDAVDSIFGESSGSATTQALPRVGQTSRGRAPGGRVLSAEEQRREAERLRRTESQRIREEKLAQLRSRQAAERKQCELERQARIQAQAPADCGRPNSQPPAAPSSTSTPAALGDTDPLIDAPPAQVGGWCVSVSLLFFLFSFFFWVLFSTTRSTTNQSSLSARLQQCSSFRLPTHLYASSFL
jgi:hypothetical protein